MEPLEHDELHNAFLLLTSGNQENLELVKSFPKEWKVQIHRYTIRNLCYIPLTKRTITNSVIIFTTVICKGLNLLYIKVQASPSSGVFYVNQIKNSPRFIKNTIDRKYILNKIFTKLEKELEI